MQEHLFHYLFTALPFVILVVFLLKKIPFTTRFQALTGVVLILFVMLHSAPVSIIFASHHQLQSDGEHHPCCIHQISGPAAQFEFVPVIAVTSFRIVSKPQIHHLPFISYHTSRSPPTIS